MNPTSLPMVLVTAFVVTLATEIIPSPSTIAASRFALANGMRAAIACLSGVVLADTLAFFGMAFGFQPLLEAIGGSSYIFPIAGLLLTGAGIAMIVSAPKDVIKAASEREQKLAELEGKLHGPFLAGFIIPIANPGDWIWWATIGTALIHMARPWGGFGITFLLVAVEAGIMTWYIPLLLALRSGRQVFSPHVQQRLLVILGIAMLGCGVFILYEALSGARLAL